jgi:GTP-binding protein Era
VVLFVTDIYEKHDEELVVERLRKNGGHAHQFPQQTDQANQEEVEAKLALLEMSSCPTPPKCCPSPSLTPLAPKAGPGVERCPPVHPPLRQRRANRQAGTFAAEMVREKIFKLCKRNSIAAK